MFSRKTNLKSHEEVAHGLVVDRPHQATSSLKSLVAPFSTNLVGTAGVGVGVGVGDGDEETFFAVEEAVEGDPLHVGDIILT